MDLEVVNMIINEKPIKKVRKAARSGSNLSKLNTTNPQFDVINKENILKKSGIDPFDLIMSSGKNIGDSKLNLFNVNGFQVVEYKGLYVINFNFAEFLADNLSEEDKKGLIHTNKGSYLVYKGN